MDGLERYYAADGSLIHWYGLSLKRMVVSNAIVANLMKSSPHLFDEASIRNKYSTPAKLLDGNETVHSLAIKAVKAGANGYLKMAQGSSGDEREAYMESYHLLMDFANGNGPYLRAYKEGSPFLNMLNKNNQMLKEVMNDFETKLSETGKTAKEYFETNQKFSGGYEFSPDHAYAEKGAKGILESIEKHYDAITKNPVEIVIGGMSYTMSPILNKKKDITGYKILFSNISGKESLLLHQATNIAPINGMSIPLSDKKQTFSFTISVKEAEELKK